MRRAIIVAGILAANSGCGYTSKSSATRDIVHRDSHGSVFVTYQDPANSGRLVMHLCPNNVSLKTPNDIARNCPTSGQKKGFWVSKEHFVRVFREVVWTADLRSLAEKSRFGEMFNYRKEVVYGASRAATRARNKIAVYEKLLEQAVAAGAESNARFYRSKIDFFQDELAQVVDVEELERQFERYVVNLYDQAMSQVRVFETFDGENGTARFETAVMREMLASWNRSTYTVFCRTCFARNDQSGRYICLRGNSATSVISEAEERCERHGLEATGPATRRQCFYYFNKVGLDLEHYRAVRARCDQDFTVDGAPE